MAGLRGTGRAALLVGLALGLAAAAVWSLASGPLAVAPADLARAAFGPGPAEAEIALSLRGPRLLAAILTGGGLAAAGAALQIVFRNPLVAPDLLGVSPAAGLGAALAILLGAGFATLQIAAFAAGLGAAGLAVGCAALARTPDPRLSLVLCGVIVGALASAGLALVAVLADPYDQLPAITYWLLGSFSRATTGEAAIAAGLGGFGVLVLLALGFRLDALSLGDDQARALGFRAGPLRLLAVAAASLVASASVSVAGVVGWIGLIAPHAARLLVGETAGRLLPASLLIGALFAVLIDRLAAAFGPPELPVGLLAAALGAPAFLILFVVTSRSDRP